MQVRSRATPKVQNILKLAYMEKTYNYRITFEIITLGFCALAGTLTLMNYVFGLAAVALLLVSVIFVNLFKHPERGLYLLILSIPFQDYNVPLGFITISATNILIIFMALIIAARFILGYDKPHIYKFKGSTFLFVLLFLLLLSAILSMLTAKNILATLRYIITTFGSILLFVIVVFILNDIRKFKTALFILTISAVLISIITILNGMNTTTQILPLTLGKIRAGHPLPIADYELPFLRNTGVIQTQGTYGIWVLAALPLLFVILFNKNIKLLIPKSRVFFLILFLIVFLGILISQSRNVWLGAVVAFSITIFSLLMKKYRNYSRIIVISIMVLMILLGSSALISAVQYYSNIYYKNVEGRLLSYKFSLYLFTNSPLTGIGDEAFEKLFIYAGRNIPLHNTFLQFLVTKGLLGFIPFALLVISSIVFMFRVAKYSEIEELKLLGICLLASLGAMVTESLFFPGAADKGLWLLLGLTNGLHLIHQKSNKSEI